MKGSLYQDDVTIINMYAPNIRSIERSKGRCRKQQYNNGRRFQYSVFNNEQNIQTEDQKGNIGLEKTLETK